MSFDSLGLRAELLSAIASLGYSTPTPIQTQGEKEKKEKKRDTSRDTSHFSRSY